MVGAEGFEPPTLCSQSGIAVFSLTSSAIPSFALRRIFTGVPRIHIPETDSLICPQFVSRVPTKDPTVSAALLGTDKTRGTPILTLR